MPQWPSALRVEGDATLAEVIGRLDAAPDAPGVLVAIYGGAPVPVTRSTVASKLAQCLASGRTPHASIGGLLTQWDRPVLELADTTALNEAVKCAVQRPPESRFEPVVIRDRFGAATMVDLRVLLLTQCTQLETAFEEVSAAKAEVESAAAARTQFLVGLGHEIRTPMTAIVGFAELLASDGLTPSEREQNSAAIRRNADHLMAVVNDLLDASKLEAGKMTVESIAFEPLACVDEAVAILRPAAENRGLRLERTVSSELPKSITADPLRLRQIVLNLLSNAIKFTAHGSVHVDVVYETAAPRPQLKVVVRDTGQGMTEQQCVQVFEAFNQADTSIARRFGGSGLGLSISRQLATLMGGTLECVSRPGEGSTFTLTIADAGAERTAIPDAEHAGKRLQGLRVLLAEDSVDTQRLIRTHLSNAGAEVVVVGDGVAAVRTALGTPGGRGFDVVLMDSEMPGMHGVQATQLLRARQYVGVILALTAHTSEEHRVQCLRAGCNGVLTKPIRRADLLEGIAAAVNGPRQNVPPAANAA